MSCVADAKAISQNTAKVDWKKRSAGIRKAMPASPAPTNTCMATIHQRFVRIRSMNGLHNGLITHGKFSQPVYKATSVLEMPMRLYITNDNVITAI